MRTIKVAMLICILINASPSNSFDNSRADIDYGDMNLNSEEAKLLALNDPLIIDLVKGYIITETMVQLDRSLVLLDDIYWNVLITAEKEGSNDQQIQLDVIIMDSTEEIISYTYSDVEYSFNWQDLSISALKYLESQPEATIFNLDESLISIAGIDNNIILIYPIDNQFEFRIYLSYNLTIYREYQFDIIKIEANYQFGDPIFDFDQASNQVYNMSIVSNFISETPWRRIETWEVLYFESPYHTHVPGYFYNFHFEYSNSSIAEYKDHELLLGIGIGSLDHNFFQNIIGMSDYHSIDIEIDGNTGEMTYFDSSKLGIYNPKEMIQLIFDDEETTDWLDTLTLFKGSFEYSGNRIYTLYIYSEPRDQKGYIKINDTSGQIIEKHFDLTWVPKLTKQEITVTIEEHLEFKEWTSKVDDYSSHAEIDNSGTWLVSYYDPVIASNLFEGKINDTTGEIMQITSSIVDPTPKKTISEIIDYAYYNEIIDLYLEFPESKIVAFYHDNQYWSLYAYSPIFAGKYVKLLIDDISGEILETRSDTFKARNYNNITEVEEFLDTVENYQNFTTRFPDAINTMYFSIDRWIIYSEQSIGINIKRQFWITLPQNPIDRSLSISWEEESELVDSDKPFYLNQDIKNIVPLGDYRTLRNIDGINLQEIFANETFSHDATFLLEDDSNPFYESPLLLFGMGTLILILIVYGIKYQVKKSGSS